MEQFEQSAARGQVRRHLDDVSGSVVVGVDGSACSRRALRFAGEEARSRGCRLVVVRAWSLTTAPRPPGAAGAGVPSLGEFEDAVAAALDADVAEVLGSAPGIDVVVRPVHDAPAEALVEASRRAVLVVVGSRGHSMVVGLLLGSVSDHLVRHAHGPVAVVR